MDGSKPKEPKKVMKMKKKKKKPAEPLGDDNDAPASDVKKGIPRLASNVSIIITPSTAASEDESHSEQVSVAVFWRTDAVCVERWRAHSVRGGERGRPTLRFQLGFFCL